MSSNNRCSILSLQLALMVALAPACATMGSLVHVPEHQAYADVAKVWIEVFDQGITSCRWNLTRDWFHEPLSPGHSCPEAPDNRKPASLLPANSIFGADSPY